MRKDLKKHDYTAIQALGRRAAACKHWLWLPGMAAWTTERGIVHDSPVVRLVSYPWKYRIAHEPDDLEEKATERANVYVQYVKSRNMSDKDCDNIGVVFTSTLLPNFDDKCTRGGLLEVVRAAWNDPRLHVVTDREDSFVRREDGPFWRVAASIDNYFTNDTEIEVLIAALEAAP